MTEMSNIEVLRIVRDMADLLFRVQSRVKTQNELIEIISPQTDTIKQIFTEMSSYNSDILNEIRSLELKTEALLNDK